MRNQFYIVTIILVTAFFSCSPKAESNKVIIIKNTLMLDRELETVELTKQFLQLAEEVSLEQISIRDIETKTFLTTQTVDEDDDGKADVLLFQAKVKTLGEKEYEIVLNSEHINDSIDHCYSRFVPERTDDYAWENNRVAFRTYGPTAQKMIEENIKGGTLSSGIDAWLKRVDYPIINRWYEKMTSGKGTYHEDTGEGLDNFHVGSSRGVGGIAKKVDNTYYFSKNFTSWKTITTGPIRTSFVLTYADWDAAGNEIKEEKHVSLDYGSNLSKFVIILKGADTISAGLTLHEQDGIVETNLKEGWVSYWEPHEDSELGTAIVASENEMVGVEHYLTQKKDESNLFAHLKVTNGKTIYYAGFGWKKSAQFETRDAWEKYLSDFSKKINNPLTIELK